MQTAFEHELEIAAEAHEFEFENPELMAGGGGVGFCAVPGCGGVLQKRGRRWICPACNAVYNSNPSALQAGQIQRRPRFCPACNAVYNSNPSAPAPTRVGPPQGHRGGNDLEKHTKRRPGASEKKDRRKKYESEFALEFEL